VGARLPQLIAGDDEVLSQHRYVDCATHRDEVIETSTEAPAFGQHADDRGAAELVVGGQGCGVVDRGEWALRRARPLHLCDDRHAVALEDRNGIEARLPPRGLCLELVEADEFLTRGEIGADTQQDVVEHAHANGLPR